VEPGGDASRSSNADSLILASLVGVVTLPFMRWNRPRLARVAAVWLVFQLALLLSVPTTLCCTASGNAAAVECTCDHDDGQMCPMHHTRARSHPSPASHSCTCRSTSDPLATLAAALVGPVAIVTPTVAVEEPFDVSAAVNRIDSRLPHSTRVPDSPPPRA
jgi:hypothetical protein